MTGADIFIDPRAGKCVRGPLSIITSDDEAEGASGGGGATAGEGAGAIVAAGSHWRELREQSLMASPRLVVGCLLFDRRRIWLVRDMLGMHGRGVGPAPPELPCSPARAGGAAGSGAGLATATGVATIMTGLGS